MYTTIKVLGKHVIQTNPSQFDEGLFSDIFVQTEFETRKRNTGFYVLRDPPEKDMLALNESLSLGLGA